MGDTSRPCGRAPARSLPPVAVHPRVVVVGLPWARIALPAQLGSKGNPTLTPHPSRFPCLLLSDSAKRTYADLKAPPTTVRCQGCPQEVDVPATAFDWTCTAGHVSKRADELCVECKIAQPKDLPEPTVTCPSCQHVTVVPSSNAKKHARESAQKTKEFAAQTAAATKAGIEHLRATPTTFRQTNNANTLADLGNCWRVSGPRVVLMLMFSPSRLASTDCAHCDTLLAVPTGEWSCQTCTQASAPTPTAADDDAETA